MEIKKVELKSIKHNVRLSEETYSYSANLYINGKKSFAVSNEGRGGCDNAYPYEGFTNKDLSIINDYFKYNFNATVFGGSKGVLDESNILFNNLEEWCCDQVTLHVLKKEMKSSLRKEVLAFSDGNMISYDINNNANLQVMISGVRKRLGANAIILNEVDEVVALKVWCDHFNKEDTLDTGTPSFDSNGNCTQVVSKDGNIIFKRSVGISDDEKSVSEWKYAKLTTEDERFNTFIVMYSDINILEEYVAYMHDKYSHPFSVEQVDEDFFIENCSWEDGEMFLSKNSSGDEAYKQLKISFNAIEVEGFKTETIGGDVYF